MGVVWHPWRFGFGYYNSHHIARVLQDLWLQRFGHVLRIASMLLFPLPDLCEVSS
jgi:hypothetical protein